MCVRELKLVYGLLLHLAFVPDQIPIARQRRKDDPRLKKPGEHWKKHSVPNILSFLVQLILSSFCVDSMDLHETTWIRVFLFNYSNLMINNLLTFTDCISAGPFRASWVGLIEMAMSKRWTSKSIAFIAAKPAPGMKWIRAISVYKIAILG